MLPVLDRRLFYADLRKILGAGSWSPGQVRGLDRLFDNFQRDPLIPDGKVGVQRVAYYLYTDWIETGHAFMPVRERGGAAYFIRMYGAKTSRGRRLGNDSDDEAIAYSGTGDVQVTGEDNFEAIEDFIRSDYPHIVEEWEARTGKKFDLTIGDQPNDRDDVLNLLDPAFSYAAMVGGTVHGLFGPPISRYINAKGAKYADARHSVNGTDRAPEFAKFCPKIEAALERAIAAAAGISAATDAEAPAVQADDVGAHALAETAGADAAAVSVQNVERMQVSSASPIPGGAKDDPPKPVTEQWWEGAKGIPSKIYGLMTAGGAITVGLISEWLGFIKDHSGLILTCVLIVALLAVGLYLMHMRYQRNLETQRQRFELEKLKLNIAADPNKINAV